MGNTTTTFGINMERAIVITPCIGKNIDELLQCINSVKKQTIPVRHLLVVDGYNNYEKVSKIITNKDFSYVDICVVPYNTGSEGFYGHRIMAAFSHLHDFEFTLFLDEDNWFEPDHVETLIDKIDKNGWKFAHSLRQIYTKEGEYVCVDECESLGLIESVDGYHLVDTSSYCFKTDFLIKVCHLWHKGWGADRDFFKSMMNISSIRGKFGSTNEHTLCYRLGGNEGSVKKEFFLDGNIRAGHK